MSEMQRGVLLDEVLVLLPEDGAAKGLEEDVVEREEDEEVVVEEAGKEADEMGEEEGEVDYFGLYDGKKFCLPGYTIVQSLNNVPCATQQRLWAYYV